MKSTKEIVHSAWKQGIPVPAFNVPYLPVMAPVVQAAVDQDAFCLVEVARLEWTKFQAKGMKEIRDEFLRNRDEEHVRLHLDHIPVIDEDFERVDYVGIIKEAIDLGFESVMVDGSRLSLEENIRCTQEVARVAHEANIPCEAELGSVLGHEDGPLPSYEEIFQSGKGFTDEGEARRFVEETECDWLSIAVGNIHGAVSVALRDQKKAEARLNLNHLEILQKATGVPLVLHGGSGIKQYYVLEAVKRGITKINVGTEIRQTYEATLKETENVKKAQEAVYKRTCWIIADYYKIRGSGKRLS